MSASRTSPPQPSNALPSITVVGSANLDIVVTVPHHPTTGETVLGGDHVRLPGGKGANQAVAAGRLGADVSFIGLVGQDDAGQTLRTSLVESGVRTEALGTTDDAPSGIALITVDAEGDNAITVSPGANALLSPSVIDQYHDLLDAAVVQLQLEIPMESVIHAADRATGIVVLDPAPAPSAGIPQTLLDAADIVVPNETELALLAGRMVDAARLDDVEAAAKSLPIETVVVTLGARGALVVAGEGTSHIPAPAITPVDTTAAGDAFRSAFSVKLAMGNSIVESATYAVRVGAATALAFGAQPSLPTPDEVDQRLQ